jgi:competence ComEA-like helix-hairpin-helix protein
MTKKNVEPHFDRRPVQITLAIFASAAVVWLMITNWHGSPRPQHNDSFHSGETADSAPAALIQIDLNRAEVRELALLPRVGPVLARRIVDNRDRLGPFTSVGDLERVHGIGPKTLDQIQSICFVDSSSYSAQRQPLDSDRDSDPPAETGSFDPAGR